MMDDPTSEAGPGRRRAGEPSGSPFSRRRFLVLASAASLGLTQACSSGRSGATGPTGTASRADRFSDAFDRPPGPLGNGWTDAHTVVPPYQDQVGIVSGGVADVALQGARDIDPSSSGWRGAFYRDLAGSTDQVRVATTVYLHPGQRTSGGGPLAFCVPDSEAWALGAWYDVGSFLNWYEFGLVGRRVEDYRWLDTCFAPHPTNGGTFELEIRASHGSAAVFANGERVCGPVPIPAELRSSTRHGGQMDIGSRPEQGVAQIRSVTIEPSRGGPIPDYQAAQVEAGQTAELAGAGSLSLALPDQVAPGDLLVAVIGLGSAGSLVAPAGWVAAGVKAGPTGLTLACYTHKSTGGDPSPAVWTGVGDAGAVGVIVRARGVNRRVGQLGLPGSFVVSADAASVTTPSVRLTGIHRLGLWAALAGHGSTIGTPSGWASLVPGSSQAPVTLTLATVADWGEGPLAVRPPFEVQGTPTPVRRAAVDPPGPSLAFQIAIQPAPGVDATPAG
jgi:hypothetical protein